MKVLPDRFAWVKEEFERVAVDGVLGDPEGAPAFGYLRVSTTGQAEEGRSGFPRQILHVHEKAQALGLVIPWNLVYFDDHTGFEFRDRPALSEMRELARSPDRPANDLVIENLDRLSREATWHQGFLLDEFENENKVRVHFWKELGSRLERAVYGTVAQDRMMTDLERMMMGNITKAKSGRVTARTPAYGYRLVNAQGGVENVKKDTYYDFYEPEAEVMRQIYRWLVEERATLNTISRRLMDGGIKPPKRAMVWDGTLLRAMIRNTVYKGEFYAHRYYYVKVRSKRNGKEVTHKVERPKNEWIFVPVPALISPEVWEEAQRVLSENQSKSTRNSRRQYLLINLTYCADCKTIRMTGSGRYWYRMTKSQGRKQYEAWVYRCVTRVGPKHIKEAMGYTCTMPQISARKLDALVWNTVVNVLLNPERLEEGMERYFSRQKVQTTREEIGFIQTRLTDLQVEDERLYQAYIAKAFDAGEFALKRYALKERKQHLEAEKEKLQKKLSHQASIEEQKRQILTTADELRARASEDLPFDLKRKIILKVVDKITVNTREEWFEIEGAISGKFDFIPADMDSWQRSA